MRRTVPLLAGMTMLVSLAGLLVVTVGVLFAGLPDVTQLGRCFTTSMNEVYLCRDSEKYVALENIAPIAAEAIVVSEDAAFFHHRGFDWHEIKASLTLNLLSGGYRRGGSTITQQLAKNAFLTNEKSMSRKLKEALLAQQIEKKFSKEQILEKYLNVVEFGDGIYGIKSAAHHYFAKSPAELNVLESAFLAFLLPNPKSYETNFTNGELTPFAKKMLVVIIQRLERFRKIPPETSGWALNQLDLFPWKALDTAETAFSSPSGPGISEDEMQEILDQETLPEPSPEEETSAWD